MHFFVLNLWVVMAWVLSCIMLICVGVGSVKHTLFFFMEKPNYFKHQEWFSLPKNDIFLCFWRD